MSDTRQTPEVFLLPDVGEGLTEADIVNWLVGPGDTVEVNEPLLEVETAKSIVELPSPFAGTVLELHAEVGQSLPVGSPLISIGAQPATATSGGSLSRPAPASTRVQNDSDAALAAGVPDPPRTAFTEANERSSRVNAPAEADIVEVGTPAGPDLGPATDRPLILVGTGPKEAANRRVRVRRPDVEPRVRFLPVTDGGSAPADWTEKSSGTPLGLDGDPGMPSDSRVPIKGVRKATAEAMVRSAFTAPHAAVWTTVDVTRTMDWVQRLKRDRQWMGVRVSPLLFVARAVTLATRRFPDINASWDDDAQEIVLKSRINLGIAAATPRGLLVPNIKNAGALTMRELGQALQDVVDRARGGKLTPEEMSEGTVTLTNVGTLGIEGATPIINPPEAMIVAPGAIQDRAWVVDGQIEIRKVMTLSLSIDHRLIDGQRAGEVLQFVRDVLEDPGAAFVYS